MINSIILLFVSLLIYGAGTATNLQARYAGTDLADKKRRAKAISVTMVMTTFGAVAGPNLVDVMGKFASIIGVPPLAGPFILSAAAFILAGLVLYILLRPDPLEIAKKIETYRQENKLADESKSAGASDNQKGITIGAAVMVLTQIVMVAIMTMTPVHMRHHGHSLGDVGIVIGFHIGSMYLPSLVTGILVDKIGRTAISIASGVTFFARWCSGGAGSQRFARFIDRCPFGAWIGMELWINQRNCTNYRFDRAFNTCESAGNA